MWSNCCKHISDCKYLFWRKVNYQLIFGAYVSQKYLFSNFLCPKIQHKLLYFSVHTGVCNIDDTYNYRIVHVSQRNTAIPFFLFLFPKINSLLKNRFAHTQTHTSNVLTKTIKWIKKEKKATKLLKCPTGEPLRFSYSSFQFCIFNRNIITCARCIFH